MKYYQQELLSVFENDTPASMKIKIQGAYSETKWLNLNSESIQALQDFLAELKTSFK